MRASAGLQPVRQSMYCGYNPCLLSAVDAETRYALVVGSQYVAGDFYIRFGCAVAPPHDSLVNAMPIESDVLIATSNVGSSSDDGGESMYWYFGAASVWFDWTADTTGHIRIQLSPQGMHRFWLAVLELPAGR